MPYAHIIVHFIVSIRNMPPRMTPKKRVGAAPAAGFSKVTHAVPMLSLNNAFSGEDVTDFTTRIRKFLGLKDSEKLEFVRSPR